MTGKYFCLIDVGGGTCRVVNIATPASAVARGQHESAELLVGGRGVCKAEAEAYCRRFFERGERIAAARL